MAEAIRRECRAYNRRKPEVITRLSLSLKSEYILRGNLHALISGGLTGSHMGQVVVIAHETDKRAAAAVAAASEARFCHAYYLHAIFSSMTHSLLDLWHVWHGRSMS